MDNQLSNYMGIELKDIIESIQVVSGTAKESGNTYYCIELRFINGYNKRLFLKSEEMFAWCNAMETLRTQERLDGGHAF